MVRNQLSFISTIQLSICTKFNLLGYLCVHYLFNECKLDLALSVLYFDNLVYNPSLTIFHLKYKICLLTIVQRINRLIHTSSYSCDSRPIERSTKLGRQLCPFGTVCIIRGSCSCLDNR